MLFRLRSLSFLSISFLLLLLSPASADSPGSKPLWTAAWITDTQTAACEWIDALIARVRAEKPSVVLHTGDTRFEWANRCAWRSVMSLFQTENGASEFHLAPGNHDLLNGVLKLHLRRAASLGLYRLDTGRKAEGWGFYHDRVPQYVSGPLWPVWNPEVVKHPAWQVEANRKPEDWRQPVIPYHYVFKRGKIRFIVCDCFVTSRQIEWVRNLIVKSDGSSVSILLQHKHEVDLLSAYFEGLEGKHNVKLVLSGDDHNFHYEKRCGVTFITGAGIAKGPGGENDAMVLRVYRDRLELVRYVIPPGDAPGPIEGPDVIWTAKGDFEQYRKPWADGRSLSGSPGSVSEIGLSATAALEGLGTVGPNLVFNGDFDNHVWYGRFRGWSPSGWYQWFTRGGHAPEHAVGRFPSPPFHAHSGKEFVRIHMWAYAWRGGILQNVRVQPCHYYRLTAFGCFQPKGAPMPNARIGIDPCGTLASQFSADVSKHPAGKYDEGIGDDPKTPEVDGPDFGEETVWSPYHAYYEWGKFQVEAEAKAPVITVILYCYPKQRPANKPIYEMNWDSVSLREIPWPTPRLVEENRLLEPDPTLKDLVVQIQPKLGTAQVTWETGLPAGASQVLYRFSTGDKASESGKSAREAPPVSGDFPLATPVYYERSQTRHWVTISDFFPPQGAAYLEVVALSRVSGSCACNTMCSSVKRISLK